MENSLAYYIFCLAAIIVGFFIVKRIASCLIKTIVMIAVVAILAFVYFTYFS